MKSACWTCIQLSIEFLNEHTILRYIQLVWVFFPSLCIGFEILGMSMHDTNNKWEFSFIFLFIWPSVDCRLVLFSKCEWKNQTQRKSTSDISNGQTMMSEEVLLVFSISCRCLCMVNISSGNWNTFSVFHECLANTTQIGSRAIIELWISSKMPKSMQWFYRNQTLFQSNFFLHFSFWMQSRASHFHFNSRVFWMHLMHRYFECTIPNY